MPTATAKSASAELRDLDQVLDNAHVEVQKARRLRDEHDRGTEQLRAEQVVRRDTHPEEFQSHGGQPHPRPGSEAERQAFEVKQRMAAPNPHADDYAEAGSAFTKLDEQRQRFLVARIGDLIAEREAEVDGAIEQIRAGFEQVLAACAQYRQIAEDAQVLAARVPGLMHKPGMTASDLRVSEWEGVARGAVEAEVRRPGLTQIAEWRLSNVE
jgi:hypothetical protein